MICEKVAKHGTAANVYKKKTLKHMGSEILWRVFSWDGVGPINWIKGIMDKMNIVIYLEV